MPPHLARGVTRGFELFELRGCGATFAYPDALGDDEWTYLKAAQRGFNRSEAEKLRRQSEEWERSKNARR